eukprot:XP_001692384.1 predicted protein [Chlamydomonas reinhardtii]
MRRFVSRLRPSRDRKAAGGRRPPVTGTVYLIRQPVVTAESSSKRLLRSNASRSHDAGTHAHTHTHTNTRPSISGNGGTAVGLDGAGLAQGKGSVGPEKATPAAAATAGGDGSGRTSSRSAARMARSPLQRWWRDVLQARRDVQLYWLLWRAGLKASRAFVPPTVLDMLVLQGAAFIVGAIQGTGWGLAAVPSNFIMAYLVLAVLSAVTHLRTFSANRTVQRYERMSGISVAASFAAANAADLGWVCLAPAAFMALYYYLVLPQAPLYLLYTVGLMVCWWSSGLAYAIATSLVPPQEYREYWSYKWNEVMVIYYNYGLCGMDKKLRALTDGGDSIGSGAPLSPAAVLSFLRSARGFKADDCDGHVAAALLVLLGLGAGLRALAYLQLRVGSEVLEALEAVAAAANKVARQV